MNIRYEEIHRDDDADLELSRAKALEAIRNAESFCVIVVSQGHRQVVPGGVALVIEPRVIMAGTNATMPEMKFAITRANTRLEEKILHYIMGIRERAMREAG